jgi:hypothetical protein
MAIQNRQIGWSQESNLLWQILKQINKLTSVIFGLKEAATPKYKVYTALLTQSGGDGLLNINRGQLTIGITYFINDFSEGMDFTNVGASNNNVGTSFVATGTTPNSWGTDEGIGYILVFNTGAPVVTVLENTIGNIWFTYENPGQYFMYSDGLFTVNKTTATPIYGDYTTGVAAFPVNINQILIINTNEILSIADYVNNIGSTPIEIRVYN